MVEFDKPLQSIRFYIKQKEKGDLIINRGVIEEDMYGFWSVWMEGERKAFFNDRESAEYFVKYTLDKETKH